MQNVFVTRVIPQIGIDILNRELGGCDVNSCDTPLSKDALKAQVKGRTGIVCLLTDVIDGEILDAAGPQLNIVSNIAVGYNNIDVKFG